MEASDKDGLARGYGAVLWQPAGSGNAGWGARNALGAAWTDPGRTATVFDSERSRRGRLTCAEFGAEVARVATRAVLSYVKKPLRHNEVAKSSGAVEPGADRS